MALSIFSSEKRVYLSLTVLLIGALVIASINIVVYLYSPDAAVRVRKEVFSRNKVMPDRKYDLVLMGDSRCLSGVDPAILEKKLSMSAFNCSFAGGGLNREIYTHVHNKLLKDSPGKVRAVVLCVTPMTMAATSRTNAAFHQARKEMTKKDHFFKRYGKILFQRVRTKKVKSLFRKGRVGEIYHENGYLEKFSRVKEKAQRNGMQQYRVIFKKLTYPQINVDELVEQTRFWRAHNVAVFAFYPPSRPPMEKLETLEISWDLKALVREFEAAGGIFLEVTDREKYNSYDSVHLASGESKRLSADLAEKIHAHLKRISNSSPAAKSR